MQIFEVAGPQKDQIQDGLLILRSEEMLRRLSPIVCFRGAMLGIKGRALLWFFSLWESIGWYVESKNDVKDRSMLLK